MLGYLRADDPGVLEPPPEGWHDTGDIVTIDAQGFVTIKGRAKRFAKVGGEMVSLAAVEMLAGELWPNAPSAVVAVPDPRKGERLILVTQQKDAHALGIHRLRARARRLRADDPVRDHNPRQDAAARLRQGRHDEPRQAGAGADCREAGRGGVSRCLD